MNQNKNAVGHITAFITIVIWGTTFISTKVLLHDFTPIEILFFRFTIGLLILFVVKPHRLRITDKKQEFMYACAGLCGVTLYYLLENIALTYSMASNVGVIVSIAPFFTAILAHFFLEEEKLSFSFFIGFIVAILGIGILSFSGSTTFRINPVGDLLAVLAAAVWAIYSVLTRKISTYGHSTVQSTRRVFFYGLLFMCITLPLFDFELGLKRFTNTVNLLNIAFLGIGASALCFVTWNFAVKLLGAVKTSIYIYIVPVITVITSIIILHENITYPAAFGTALTLTGLLLSKRQFSLGKKRDQQVI